MFLQRKEFKSILQEKVLEPLKTIYSILESYGERIAYLEKKIKELEK